MTRQQVPSPRMGFFHLNDILNGTGSVGALAGDGIADQYLNSDRTHPCTAGEIYEAPIVAARVAACLQAL